MTKRESCNLGPDAGVAAARSVVVSLGATRSVLLGTTRSGDIGAPEGPVAGKLIGVPSSNTWHTNHDLVFPSPAIHAVLRPYGLADRLQTQSPSRRNCQGPTLRTRDLPRSSVRALQSTPARLVCLLQTAYTPVSRSIQVLPSTPTQDKPCFCRGLLPTSGVPTPSTTAHPPVVCVRSTPCFSIVALLRPYRSRSVEADHA